MLIKLCMDLWRAYFDWLSLEDRKKLALKFNEIEDSEFSALGQLWLHKWSRNVLLGNISTENPLPTTELPDNIVGFKSIQIRRMDTTVRQFLRTMQPLFQNVNLDVFDAAYYNTFKPQQGTGTTVLHRLLPFLTGGIDTVNLCAMERLFTIREFPAQFFSIERLQLDMWFGFFTFTEEFMELLLLWLCTRRADGHPRMLRIRSIGEDAFGIEQIRQKFREASSPVCFFIWISANYGTFDDMEETATIQNANTSEQLMIRKQEDADGFGWDYLSIGRCPSELDGQIWMREMLIKSFERTEQRNIQITTDPIEEAMPEENEGDEEEGLDQPGTSGDKQQS